MVGGVEATLKNNGVETLHARGKIIEKTADGFSVKADGNVYTGKKLLIATGSAPALPPIPGLSDALKSGFALTSREMLDLPRGT